MNISIIIVNYNTTAYVKLLIESIFTYLKAENIQIVVVDNSPCVEVALKSDLRIDYIHLTKNVGFGAACNVAVSYAKFDILFFVNPDIVFSHDICGPILNLLRKGLVCGITLVSDRGVPEVSYGNFPTLSYFFVRFFKIDILFPFLRKKFHIGIAPYSPPDASKYVDYVSGAFFAIMKDDFNSVNGFDEDFFLYFEEADLFFRLSEKGVKCFVPPEIFATHFGSVSTGKNSVFKYKAMKESIRIYFKKRNQPISAVIAPFLFR